MHINHRNSKQRPNKVFPFLQIASKEMKLENRWSQRTPRTVQQRNFTHLWHALFCKNIFEIFQPIETASAAAGQTEQFDTSVANCFPSNIFDFQTYSNLWVNDFSNHFTWTFVRSSTVQILCGEELSKRPNVREIHWFRKTERLV